MEIVKGKTKPNGLRIVIYGVHGIGKTTLASKLRKSLFLDFEEGTNGIDVNKLSANEIPKSYASMKGLVNDLKNDHRGYLHLIVDTADKMEQSLSESLAREKKVEDIFSVNDFGRTVCAHKAGIASVLDALSDLAKSGMDVVFIAHETSRKVEPLESRDTTGTYDHHEMKLSKTVSPLFMEWADVVIFCAYKTFLVSGQNKMDKSHIEGGKRWCFASYSNDWDAKTRTGINIPEDCSLDKMIDVLPKAIEDAVGTRGNTVIEPTAQVTVNDPEEPACNSVVDAAASPVAEDRQEEESEDVNPPLKILFANYGISEEQIIGYIRSNKKVSERYGNFRCDKISDIPEPVVSWLMRVAEKVSQKIKNGK